MVNMFYRKFEVIDDCVKRLEQIKGDNPSFEAYRKSWKDRDAAERNIQKIIEAIIDIGKIIINSKNLRVPSNNKEVFEILEENDLFPSTFMYVINSMIGMRNIIVHSYDRVDDEVVYGVIRRNIGDIENIADFFKKLFTCNEKLDLIP